jgi:exopolysaccharide production protein ExoQ
MSASLSLAYDRAGSTAPLLPAFVGFFLSFRLFSVVLSVRLFGADPVAGVGASLAMSFLLAGVVGFCSIGPASRTLASFVSIPSFRWVVVFLCFSGCSLLWSSTALLAAAVAYWCAMTCDVAIVFMLLRIGSIEDTSSALMRGYVWGTCTIAAIAWMLPAQSDLRLGDEEFLGPNQIGYACAFAFFLAQYLMRRNEKGWAIPAGFLAITLLRSLSKTTIVAFVAGQALLLVMDRGMSRKAKVVLACAALLVVAVFWKLFEAYYYVYTHAGNQSETLTGRIGIWAFILNEALQQPWIGHGFHSVWKIIPPFGSFEARHAHNELLQQFYAYGVVGVCMLAGVYTAVFREIRKLPANSLKTFFFGLLLFILVRGLADTEVFDLSLPLWSIVLIGSILQKERLFFEAVA